MRHGGALKDWVDIMFLYLTLGKNEQFSLAVGGSTANVNNITWYCNPML